MILLLLGISYYHIVDSNLMNVVKPCFSSNDFLLAYDLVLFEVMLITYKSIMFHGVVQRYALLLFYSL